MPRIFAATGKDLHVDLPLTQVALNYKPMNMIAPMVAPMVPVNKQSDAYLIWSKADALRVEDDTRAPGTRPNLITRNVSSGTFFCKNRALATELTDEDKENMDAAYISELRNGRARFVVDKLSLAWEKRIANQVNSTSNVGSSSGVSSGWSDLDAGDSDPIGDIFTAIYNVKDTGGGYGPNRMIMGDAAWRNFRQHADVVDILYGNDRSPNGIRFATREQVKAIFELDQFLVGETYENTADSGQTATVSQMWGDNVLVYYAPMNPTKDTPSFMYTFRWQKPGIQNMQARSIYYEDRLTEEIHVGYYQDEKITSSELSFLITDVNSA
jgi:hypothetical protein